MRQIVYFSTAAARQDEATIGEILEVSRQRNLRDDITGLLVAGGNRFLQVLEGNYAAVGGALARIQQDGRHVGMTIFVDRQVASRDFNKWTMAFCGEPRLDEFSSFGALAEQMHEAVDPDLRDQIKCFSETFTSSHMHLAASPWPSNDR